MFGTAPNSSPARLAAASDEQTSLLAELGVRAERC
jgi:hypothetical protein